MPRKSAKKKTLKRSNRRPSENAMILYKGPVHLPRSGDSARPVKVNGYYYAAATTSGGGVIDVVFGSSPAVLNEWTTWQSLYHEYRVLAIELKYIPVKNVANWSYGIASTVVDRQTSSALGSITAATNHESHIAFQMYEKWTRTARMMGNPDDKWMDISSPASTFFIKCYSTGNATIQTIGGFFLTYLIEFRTKA